ncbi:putative conserved hypothetical protein [Methanothermobacter sp. MT-2]|nr:putative conserved hypothetical protein [Methanothermobacter sp. MT-2]
MKSWVDGPWATMVNVLNFSAKSVGILPPPILPIGPGCTDGLKNKPLSFEPFLKANTPTIVSMGSPISSNKPSRAGESSVIWDKNKLKNSSEPTPRLRRIGDSTTSTKE